VTRALSNAKILPREPPFDLAAYLTVQRKYVDAALEGAVDTVRPESVCQAMRYSLLSGGKRLRPILCLASCELAGGAREVATPTACGLEMLHTASLIHDDLPAMDDDDFRRGRPSNHKVFGEGMALLAGDALLAYALEFILDNTKGVPAERLLRVMHRLIHHVGVAGLVGGQAVDLACEGATEVDLATLEFIHSKKTGALVEAAVVTGAILAGADEDLIERLARYARRVGLAFQIIDDVLDVTGSEQELGKTPHKDARSCKATYPALLGVAESRRQASALIDAAVAELAPLSERAAPLLAMADFIRTRSS
jgi:geranylgeranyl diphosphate synthase type II